jgi:hypothetical protein
MRQMRAATKKLLAMPPLHLFVRALRPDPIFQIGFNKCGTTSLHRFLLAGGIPSLHWTEGLLAERMVARMDAGEDPIRDFPQTIGFTDMISVRLGRLIEPYKRFDFLHRWYPDALFILNTRDRENWIASRTAHELRGNRLMAAYAKCLEINEAQVADFWRSEWDTHHTLVRAYFGSAPNFFEFNIELDNPQELVAFIARRYPRCGTARFDVHNQRKQNV